MSLGATPGFSILARFHDIFLDYLSYRTVRMAPPILDARFRGLLRPEEERLRERFTEFILSVRRDVPEATTTAAWSRIEKVEMDLGGPVRNRGGW